MNESFEVQKYILVELSAGKKKVERLFSSYL